MLVFLGPGRVDAQADPADLLEAGRAAERALDFSEAFDAYQRAATSGEGTRAGRRAEQRASHLRERRDPDGGFASLVALEQMRRADPSDARLSAFETEVDAMPEGVVRDDALFLLAESWFRRRGDPARALPIYERLLALPSLPAARRRTVGVAIAEARTALGETDEALRTIEREGLGETFEGRALEAEVVRGRARGVALVLFVLSVLALLVIGRPVRFRRGALSRLSWRHAAAVAYVLGVPALIAELYEPETADAFLYYAVVALPLLGLAALCAPSLSPARSTARRRALFLATLFTAQLAGAWLALDLADGLGGFGFP